METVYTIGHPNRPTDEFLYLLREHGIERVLDIRTFPKARKDRPNLAWRNASFRGNADHMQTDECKEHVDLVARLAGAERCVLMCAEALPWRCHRSMVADAPEVRGLPVEHIIDPGKTRIHTLTPFARVSGAHILYPLDAAAS